MSKLQSEVAAKTGFVGGSDSAEPPRAGVGMREEEEKAGAHAARRSILQVCGSTVRLSGVTPGGIVVDRKKDAREVYAYARVRGTRPIT
jgi:hypothetical protein